MTYFYGPIVSAPCPVCVGRCTCNAGRAGEETWRLEHTRGLGWFKSTFIEVQQMLSSKYPNTQLSFSVFLQEVATVTNIPESALEVMSLDDVKTDPCFLRFQVKSFDSEDRLHDFVNTFKAMVRDPSSPLYDHQSRKVTLYISPATNPEIEYIYTQKGENDANEESSISLKDVISDIMSRARLLESGCNAMQRVMRDIEWSFSTPLNAERR